MHSVNENTDSVLCAQYNEIIFVYSRQKQTLVSNAYAHVATSEDYLQVRLFILGHPQSTHHKKWKPYHLCLQHVACTGCESYFRTFKLTWFSGLAWYWYHRPLSDGGLCWYWLALWERDRMTFRRWNFEIIFLKFRFFILDVNKGVQLTTQRAHDVKITSLWRQNDVILTP